MAQRESGERAARVRVGVRRPLAGEIRREQQPLRARLPALGLASSSAVLGAEHVAQPGERAGRAQHHAHRVPGTGTAWQKTCTRASRVGLRTRGAPRTPRRTCRARPRPRPGATIPTPSAAAAWSPAPPTSVDSCAGGSQSSGISSAAQTSSDQRRLRDVEEQRPRGVRGVDRALAGQPEADVVLRQQHVPDPRVQSPARAGAARGASAR